MKRMNEVFGLPVFEKNLMRIADSTTLEDDAAIIHAINHVDALADALAFMLSEAKDGARHVWEGENRGAFRFEDSADYAAFKKEYSKQIAALAAYRGEK